MTTSSNRPARLRSRAAATPASENPSPESAVTEVASSPEVEAPSTATFADAYTKLRQGVDKLRSSDLSNIDDLVPLVEQTTAAYKVCKDRLSSVEKLVAAALGKDT